MKINDLKQRLRKERPMTVITLRMPEDVVEDLKQLAPLLGFTGYQPLMRAYIGQGLRADLERLDGNPEIAALLDRLRVLGVKDEVINQAFHETFHVVPVPDTQHPYLHEPFNSQTRPARIMVEQTSEYQTDVYSKE